AAKHVLMCIANQTNQDPYNPSQHIAFMSIDYLVWATGQNRKTVIANMKLLQEWGLIEDTGRRIGRTRQIPVYRVNCGPDLFHEQSRNRNRSKIGSLPAPPLPKPEDEKGPKTGTVPKSEQSQIPPERVPILGHGTKSISLGGDARAPAREDDGEHLSPEEISALIAPFDIPEGVDPEMFARFVKHREEKRLPLTGQTWFLVLGDLRRLIKMGADVNLALKEAIRRG